METTGTSLWYDHAVMIGWSLGGRYEVVFPGAEGDKRLTAALASANALVTFDGPRLDLPFLKKQYPNIVLPSRQIDLRPLLRRKYGAGASNIPSAREHRFERGPNLWYGWRAGDPGALRRLIENNHAAIQAAPGDARRLLGRRPAGIGAVAEPRRSRPLDRGRRRARAGVHLRSSWAGI